MIKKLLKQNYPLTETSDIFDKKFSVSYRRKSNVHRKPQSVCFDDRMKIVIEGQVNESSITEICKREGISLITFNKWTQEFLEISNGSNNGQPKGKVHYSDIDKFKIVIEGKSGETSIAEICKRENITHEKFLDWSQTFQNLRNKLIDKYSTDKSPVLYKNAQLLSSRASVEVFNYASNYVDFSLNSTVVTLKANSSRLDHLDDIMNFINLERINDIRYINKYFEKVNSKLQNGGIFVGCLETFTARRKRKKINRVPIINSIYFSIEFLFKRVMPKISFTKKHYFDITKGSDRLLSKAEGLGRLVSCGFKIMDFKSIDGLIYFVVKKVGQPSFDVNPSYGPVYKMPRLGKNGKIIGVYKFRTMHPYSEYLQDYIIKAHGYASTGKPANDFRVPKWGKFMRRLWLDEIPQLVNVLKGELKLVGVRPVSERYFQDIPYEMQKLRLTQIPGCIPPYVALNRSGSVMSVLQSEKEYLEEKIKKPYTTDTKYFFNAIYNIIFKHKRSA